MLHPRGICDTRRSRIRETVGGGEASQMLTFACTVRCPHHSAEARGHLRTGRKALPFPILPQSVACAAQDIPQTVSISCATNRSRRSDVVRVHMKASTHRRPAHLQYAIASYHETCTTGSCGASFTSRSNSLCLHSPCSSSPLCNQYRGPVRMRRSSTSVVSWWPTFIAAVPRVSHRHPSCVHHALV